MDTLPREDVLPHLTSKVGPQLGRGGFGVEGGEEGVEVSKLGGAEEGTEDGRAGDAIKEIPKIKSETNKHIIGIETAIYLFLKLIIENNATAVTGVKFGG